MAIETKQLHALSKIYKEAVYGGAKKEAPKDTRLVVTAADKKANTKAYQNYKAGNKGYKAADHLKDDKDWGYDKKGNSLNPVDKMKKERKKDELTGSPNVKKEAFSDWRTDLKEVPNYEQIPISAKKRNEKISEKNIKNTVKINPEMKEEAQIISEKEVDVKDTRRTVDAIKKHGTVSKHDKGGETEVDKAMKNFGKKKKKTAKESFELWEIAPSFDYSTLREKYYNKEIFKRGDIVESLHTGLVGKVTRRGANHLICVTESGIMFKSWIKDVSEAYTEKKKDSIERLPGKPNTLIGTKGYLKYAEKMTPGSSYGKEFINKYKAKK